MSGLLHVVDASVPPASAADLPAGTVGILGYLGPVNRTPHVWTGPEAGPDNEWDRFAHLLQMGIWLADHGGDPSLQANEVAAAARQLGWHHGRGILLDFEDTAEPAFISELGRRVRSNGYIPLGYESAGVLNANPRLDGIVLAQPGQPGVVPAGHLIIGRQYAWDVPCGGTVVDLDVFDSSVSHLFGRGPRK